MELVALIVAVLGLIPVYFLIKAKLGKRYKFDIDFENTAFALFLDPQNARLNERLCLVLYVLRVVNSSDEANTLKDIVMSYQFDGKIYQVESHVVPTGAIPQAGKPAIILSNGLNNIFLMGWHNIRPRLGECETLQPRGVFSGSAIFLFEPHIKDLRRVKNLKLIVTDFHGNQSSYILAVKDDWFKYLDSGFAVINKAFTIVKDNVVRWD